LFYLRNIPKLEYDAYIDINFSDTGNTDNLYFFNVKADKTMGTRFSIHSSVLWILGVIHLVLFTSCNDHPLEETGTGKAQWETYTELKHTQYQHTLRMLGEKESVFSEWILTEYPETPGNISGRSWADDDLLPDLEKKPKSMELYPTGKFPDDLLHIQELINQAGKNHVDVKILLKATDKSGKPTAFNFGKGTMGQGSGGFVIVFGEIFSHAGSIEIVGEEKDRAMTTIRGGITYERERGVRFESLAFVILNRKSVSFRKVRFTENAAIQVFNPGPQAFVVEDCVFDGMIGSPLRVLNTAESLIIKDNIFTNYGWEVGIFNDHPDCLIEDNHFESESFGLTLFKTSGQYSIKNNSIEVKTGSFKAGFTYGIFVSSSPGASIAIEKNDIQTDGVGLYINDVAGPQTSPILCTNNEIEIVDDRSAGMAVYICPEMGSSIENVCLADNKISGEGFWAIEVSSLGTYNPAFPTGKIHSLLISDNDLGKFSSSCAGIDLKYLRLSECADIYFDPTTRDIIYCGKDARVADQGNGNSISEDRCPSGC